MQSHHQIVIVGAGAVGSLLALNLYKQGKDVQVIETRPQGVLLDDARTLALSYQSIQLLREAGIRIPTEAMTLIQRVHISQEDCFGQTLLKASDLNLPYLGAVIDYKQLIYLCDQAMIEAGVPVLWQSRVVRLQTTSTYSVLEVQQKNQLNIMTAGWTVLAEGGQLTQGLSGIQQKIFDYHQSALVATVEFEQPSSGVALERFSKNGPLALLPYGSAYRLVWTLKPEEAELMSQQGYLSEVGKKLKNVLGGHLGEVRSVTDMAIFPLMLKQLNRVYSGRVLCVGNAAQTMHPVAAQGLNLGLRDTAVLSKLFADEQHYASAQQFAKAYVAKRYVDVRFIVGFTHLLVTWFEDAPEIMHHGRGAVMATLDLVSPLRKKFVQYLVFGL